VIYLYLLNVGATLLLLGRFRRANPISKTQSIIILVASIFPWSGNIIYISGLALPMVDLTPVGFTLSGIIVLWSMTQHQLFRILPVARETLLSNMKELVIVLDLNSFILDMNASAQQMFGAYPLPIGKKSSEVFAQWPELFHSITSKEFAEKEIRILIGEHLVHWFEVRCTPFYNERNVLLGTLVVCRDVTVRKHQEMEREHMLRELQDAMANIKTLSGLLPICSSCKKIRNDKGYWQQVETYIMSHAEIRFTHGICPECTDKLYGNYLKANKGPQKS
jgi:PAS domain-containing protein